MRRSGFKPRTKPLAPGKPPTRGGQLRRGTRVNPVNRERKAANYARNFGDEAAAVRGMACLCFAVGHHQMVLRARGRTDMDHMRPCSKTGIDPAHVTARGQGGAKGGRFDIVPLCRAHHDEAGEARTSQRAEFEQRYGLDLRAESDRVAIGHASPLGIRGLAQRWTYGGTLAAVVCGDVLDGHELDALLGWVRRELAREVERSPRYEGYQVSLRPDDRDGLARHIATVLGGPFADAPELAWALCDAAGWPGAGS